MDTTTQPTLVLGGTGKTGRRVVQRLQAHGRPVRIGTPSSSPSFDWNDPDSWPAALDGTGAVYLSYYPDLAVPGAVAAVRSFAELAVRRGVPRLALLSGRGEPDTCSARSWTAATPAPPTASGALLDASRGTSATTPAPPPPPASGPARRPPEPTGR